MRNTINLYCLKYKITPNELALKLGISKQKVSELLQETCVVPADLVQELCQIFNCESKDLIL